MAYSRLALQTQDLDARKVNFLGIWGDFGGTRGEQAGVDGICGQIQYTAPSLGLQL